MKLFKAKKSKKKQLRELKFAIFLLRDGLEVQREHAVHLAKTYANREQFAKSTEQLYTYVIEKLKEIEEYDKYDCK